MYTFVEVKKAKQPASQSCPMERREPDARCGNKCACTAAGGSCGRSNWQVCVDTILSPLGIVTVMPFFTVRMFLMGMSVCT